MCIVHKRKTRGHNYKQSLRHQRLSGTALQIVEDGFQISLKNREVVCVQGRVEAQGRALWRCLAEHGLVLKETWECVESWVSPALEELLLSSAIWWEILEEMKLNSTEVHGGGLRLGEKLGHLIS